MHKTMYIKDLARVVRSKNAGPFKITLDLFFDTDEVYEMVKNSGVITRETLAKLYRIPETQILGIYFADNSRGIKITLLRDVSSGSPDDRDVYGAQQYIPLLTLAIPIGEDRSKEEKNSNG